VLDSSAPIWRWRGHSAAEEVPELWRRGEGARIHRTEQEKASCPSRSRPQPPTGGGMPSLYQPSTGDWTSWR
jgi:hypothetical protein